MSLATNPEGSSAYKRATEFAMGLFGKTNKTEGSFTDESNPVPINEYTSSLKDVDLLILISEWQKTYDIYYEPIKVSQDKSFKYWIGKQRTENYSTSATTPTDNNNVDNLIFEAVETFLPIATSANPQAIVTADPSEMGQKIAKVLMASLIKEADNQKLRRKLAKMTRHWSIYKIGAIKSGYDVNTQSITCDVIPAKRFIFDKDGYVDEGGIFRGEYVGEKKKDTAAVLCHMFPSKKEIIMNKAGKKKGTKLQYIEWWYKDTDVFYSLGKEEILGKGKNPNWNYDIKKRNENDEITDETEKEGINFLKNPQSPYVFLSIFSLGTQPHDDTSLVEQNISKQNLINKRWQQIDHNVDGMNNGLVVSGLFTEDQAAGAASALRRGTAIKIPSETEDIRKHVMRFPAVGLPGDVYENLKDARSEIRNSFGTAGSTPQSQQQQDTVRGKILVAQQDTSRIGGTITQQIEQVADSIYNYWVQLMFVYYDDEHFILNSGVQGGMELLSLTNDQFPFVKSLSVTVKEGSLIPKDPLTQRNEAMDLWSANAIDPRSLFNKLDFPDPDASTQSLMLWQMFQKGQISPQQYLPTFQVPGGQSQPGQPMPPTAGVGGNAVNPLDNGQPIQGQQPPVPASLPAVETQSKQLLESIPIK